MAQVTIQTSKESRKNKSYIIGGREIKFDEYLMTEIPERYLEEVLTSDSTISLVDEGDVKKYSEMKEKIQNDSKTQGIPIVDVSDENNKLKIENEQLQEANKKLKKDNDKLVEGLQKANKTIVELQKKIDSVIKPAVNEVLVEEKSINDMKKHELLVKCKKLDYPEDEWKNLTVDKLKDYIKGKQVSSEEDDSIENMNLEQLKALCIECEFPIENWENLEEDDLRTYVKGQIENLEQ